MLGGEGGLQKSELTFYVWRWKRVANYICMRLYIYKKQAANLNKSVPGSAFLFPLFLPLS